MLLSLALCDASVPATKQISVSVDAGAAAAAAAVVAGDVVFTVWVAVAAAFDVNVKK